MTKRSKANKRRTKAAHFNLTGTRLRKVKK